MKMAALPLLALLLLAASATAGDDWGPWQAPKSGHATAPAGRNNGLNPLQSAVHFFQKYISPVDGPRCRMYPTCSAYALQALDKHGPLVGTMMTVDRLLHESDPREHRHPVRVGDRVRFYDSVENNDFWFADR